MTTYEIKVKTGDRFGAGTDANVEIVLLDGSKKQTKPAYLDNWFRNDFERNQLDVFTIVDETDIPEVTEIKLKRDQTGLFSDWFVDTIEVTNVTNGVSSLFPILRWIRPDVDIHFTIYDTFLPQYDPRPEQRNSEIKEKLMLYEYQVKRPGLPVQIKNLPDDEQFSDSHMWDLLTRKYTIMAGKTVEMIFGQTAWETLEDMKSVFSNIFGNPLDMDVWHTDENFGCQRLNRVNSNLIRLCTSIPDKFGVTESMIAPFLEGFTLSEAIANNRVFITDLEILEGIDCQKGLHVFLPNDPPYTWIAAKMWYNLADCHYHQGVAHLGCTHLIMEGFWIAANRCLSPSHPVYKLLGPHCYALLAVNTRGFDALLRPGGYVDKTMALGSDGLSELMVRGIGQWRMNMEGDYLEFLKQRGVYCRDGSILPTFYQRDDSLAIYDVIRSYVTDYVSLYYDTSEKLLNDAEIQNFGQELFKPKSENGCGILGLPFENGRFTSVDELVVFLTSMIFTSSVVHAAVNFAQYDTYGYFPNYPPMLKGPPPKNKNPLEEKDILNILPDKSVILESMLITKILSGRSVNSIGDFEMTYTYDPAAAQIIDKFREDLKSVSRKIHQRNDKVENKYDYLLPEGVPNSISV
uniref:Allene oxide synthase-lipoxygenase protein n=1 Tax=Magallana gigas TaxID=29159 RepID=K1R5X6_MAGGI